MTTGNANAYLELVQYIVSDMADGSDKAVVVIAEKMRSTVSDQASVNKRLNVLVKELRETLLPIVIDGFDQMSLEQKKHSMLQSITSGMTCMSW
jgi:hypothetical protein